MTINSTNYAREVQDLSKVAGSSLEKIAAGIAINQASDNVSDLALSNLLESQRSTVSQSLSNINNGIAMSNIAQGGLNEQANLLEKMNTLTIQSNTATTSDEGKAAIKEEISKYVEQFSNIAESTNYSGKQLLANDTNDLSITTGDDSYVDMQSSDTKSIAKKLEEALKSFEQDPKSFADQLKQSMDDVSNAQSQFSSASNQMESSGRTAIAQEATLEEASSAIVGVDYSKEVSNFSKSNIQAQIGMIVSSQANAVMERNVRLLS